MHIKHKNGQIIMEEGLVCPDYVDMKHFKSTFEKISDNEYKCDDCGKIIEVKEPVLVHGKNGTLKMQISIEEK